MEGRGSIEARGLGKDFEVGDETLVVLDGVDFDVDAGEALVITGPSGTGKSTLLHLIGTLERPSRGTLEVNGRPVTDLDDVDLARFRNREVGFVFQDHHLLPQYTVLENVLLPTLAFGEHGSLRSRAERLLDSVGLSHRVDHRPAQLSGGERQRAAIARALINDPSILLCDEPTGNLDPETADRVADLLFELHEAAGSTLIAVTHSLALAGRFPRRLGVDKGRLTTLTGAEPASSGGA